MNVGAVFVLYNPSDAQVEALLQRIGRASLGPEYVIVDNSLCPSRAAQKVPTEHYLCNENRGGIAGAFNRGVEYLLQRGCDFVFTFDQDSSIESDFFEGFERYIARTGAQLVCPDFVDVNSGTVAHFIVLNRLSFQVVKAGADAREPLKVSTAISSGLGFSASLFRALGGFNEAYFIDHVDTAFCFAAARNGQRVWVNRQVKMRHAIGRRTARRILFLTVIPSNHPPFRRYYMARNGLDVTRQMLGHHPAALLLEIGRMGHELLSIALFEDEKMRKLRAIALGWADGVRGRLGVAPANL